MSRRRTDVTPERAQFLFEYVPETGALLWRNPAGSGRGGRKAGDVAGTVSSNARRYVFIDGYKYVAHRIVWLIVHGVMPLNHLSAKDGNYLNLRPENYVELSPTELARRARRDNKSGARGVYFDTKRGKWQASITNGYRQVSLGRYFSKEEASAAYEKAAAERDGTVAAENAEMQKKALAVKQRGRLRTAWKKTLRQTYNLTEWASFEAFAADVKDVPDTKMILVPVNAERTLGPGNWQWQDARKFDYSTKEGKRAYSQSHREQNRNAYRDKALRKAFGVGWIEYEAMLRSQNGVCGSCGHPETDMRNGRVRILAVDHCHDAGEIRGLLCGACNKGVGLFKDDPALLRAMADYIERHLAKRAAGAVSNVIPLKKPGAS